MAEQVAYMAGESDWLGQQLRERAPDGLSLTVVAPDASPADREAAVRTATAIIAEAGSLPADLTDGAPGLRFVQLLSGSVRDSELAALEARGVAVAGLGDAVAPAAAAHVIALMGALLGKAGPGRDFAGKIVGIIGLGRVGTELARQLNGVARELICHDVRTLPRGIGERLGLRRATHDRLLVAADVVAVLVPLTEQTRGGIDARDLRLMRREAVLVNASAPDVLARGALATALRKGEIAGVGITYSDRQLERLGKVVSSPYPDAPDEETRERIFELVTDNLRRFSLGRRPRSVVESMSFPRAGDPAFWSSRMSPREPED